MHIMYILTFFPYGLSGLLNFHVGKMYTDFLQLFGYVHLLPSCFSVDQREGVGVCSLVYWNLKTGGLEIPEPCYTETPVYRRVQ